MFVVSFVLNQTLKVLLDFFFSLTKDCFFELLMSVTQLCDLISNDPLNGLFFGFLH